MHTIRTMTILLHVLLVFQAPGAAVEDLSPRPGLTLVGQVVRESDGAPVPGARLWLPRPGSGDPAKAWAAGDLLETTTAEDGTFRLGGVARGRSEIRIDAPGFARFNLPLMIPGVEQYGEVTLGDVRLQEGITLQVNLRARRCPLKRAVARVDLLNQGREMDMLTSPVAKGTATFRHVPPGRVTVSVLSGRRLLCERQVEIPWDDVAEMEVDCRRSSRR